MISNSDKFFDDAGKFKPERWLQKNNHYHPFATLPFGFGKRMCLGRRFADLEMQTLIAKVSKQTYSWDLPCYLDENPVSPKSACLLMNEVSEIIAMLVICISSRFRLLLNTAWNTIMENSNIKYNQCLCHVGR